TLYYLQNPDLFFVLSTGLYFLTRLVAAIIFLPFTTVLSPSCVLPPRGSSIQLVIPTAIVITY
ncbi:MAG: hypothetical protein WBI55_00725, partial [Eubacteriales bacterium]